MIRERGSPAESKNCEILLLPTADRRFDTKVKCPTGRASFWVKFPTVRNLMRVKCPGIARGGMGGFGIDWYITVDKLHHNTKSLLQNHTSDGPGGSPRSSYKVSPDWRPPFSFNERTKNRNNEPKLLNKRAATLSLPMKFRACRSCKATCPGRQIKTFHLTLLG